MMKNDDLLTTLSQLVSEERNADTMDIDLLSSLEILEKINHQDQLVPLAVKNVLPEVALAVDAMASAFKIGGRLI